MDNIVNSKTLAGFDLCGWKQKDGTIKLDDGQTIKEFPKEVEMCGNIYTLEYVDEVGDGINPKGMFVNAIYV